MKKKLKKNKVELLLFQKIALVFWILTILFALFFQFLFPNSFSVEGISSVLLSAKSFSLLGFLLLVSFRPLTLIPGTVLVFAGLLLFDPMTVFIVSMIGVVISGTGVYFFSHLIGLDKIFERKYSSKMKNATPHIDKYGSLFIAGWSAFPLVPDDLICYLSGAIRFNYLKFIIAFTLGGALPIGVYSFLGSAVFDSIF